MHVINFKHRRNTKSYRDLAGSRLASACTISRKMRFLRNQELQEKVLSLFRVELRNKMMFLWNKKLTQGRGLLVCQSQKLFVFSLATAGWLLCTELRSSSPKQRVNDFHLHQIRILHQKKNKCLFSFYFGTFVFFLQTF